MFHPLAAVTCDAPVFQVSDISERIEQLKHELSKCQASLDMELGAVGGASPRYDVSSMTQLDAELHVMDLLRTRNYAVALQSVSSLK